MKLIVERNPSSAPSLLGLYGAEEKGGGNEVIFLVVVAN